MMQPEQTRFFSSLNASYPAEGWSQARWPGFQGVCKPGVSFSVGVRPLANGAKKETSVHKDGGKMSLT